MATLIKSFSTSWGHAAAALLVVVMASAAGCGSETNEEEATDSGSDAPSDVPSDTEEATDTGPEVPSSFVRVLHLSPDAPAVDIYAGSDKVIDALAYGSSSDYLEVPAGTYTFAVTVAGGALKDAVLTIPDVVLAAGAHTTAVAYGAVASLSAMALVDDWEDIDSGNIRVRAVHAAQDVGQVDVWSLPLVGEPAKLYDNVPFGAAGEYLDVPAGAYFLGIDTNEDALPELIFETPALTGGAVVSLFAVNDGAVSLLAQLDADNTAMLEQGTAEVRVLHASPEAPAVDVYVNDGATPALAGLAYGKSTEWVSLQAAGYDFHVTASGSPVGEAVLHLEGALLRPGRSYTAIAYGALETLAAEVFEESLGALAETDIRVRPIHAAAAVGEVDILEVTSEAPATLWQDVPYAAIGGPLDIPSGEYVIGFDVDNDLLADVRFGLPALEAGTIANAVAVSDSGVRLLVQFEDGTTALLFPLL